jgi:ATP-dependent Zn protease
MNLGKSPARFDERPDTGFSFDDIAGIDEANSEKKLFHFKSQRDTRLEQKIPKGVLLDLRYWKNIIS